MNEIIISDRQKRLLSSLLFVLEQKTESIEHMLKQPAKNASYSIEQDLSDSTKKNLSKACKELKSSMQKVSENLNLSRRKISQYQYIRTIQSQMWENVSDAFSDKLKGYGQEVAISAKQADSFIQQLSDKIDKLKI